MTKFKPSLLGVATELRRTLNIHFDSDFSYILCFVVSRESDAPSLALYLDTTISGS